MQAERSCLAHFQERAVAICHSCDRGMCGECWRLTLDDTPWCSDCIAQVQRPISPVLPLVGGGLLMLLLVVVTGPLAWDSLAHIGGLAIAAILVSLGLWRVTRRANQRRSARPYAERPGQLSALALQGHPYRGVARRVARRLTPPLSGGLAGLVVGGALIASAAIIPKTLHLPRWLEFEAIVLCWFLLLFATLTTLLYRGWRIALATMPSVAKTEPKKRSKFNLSDLDGLDGCSGCLDLEGLAVLLLAAASVALGWVVVEFVVPAVVFAVYVLLLGALRQVANDQHECAGNLVRATGWAAFWAATYTVPLALLIYLVQLVLAIGPNSP